MWPEIDVSKQLRPTIGNCWNSWSCAAYELQVLRELIFFCTFTFSVLDPTVTMLCMEKRCPTLLLLNESTSYNFQCYSNQAKPKAQFRWKINKIETWKGITEERFMINETNVIGDVTISRLSLFTKKGYDNITCILGGASSVTHIDGKFLFFQC